MMSKRTDEIRAQIRKEDLNDTGDILSEIPKNIEGNAQEVIPVIVRVVLVGGGRANTIVDCVDLRIVDGILYLYREGKRIPTGFPIDRVLYFEEVD